MPGDSQKTPWTSTKSPARGDRTPRAPCFKLGLRMGLPEFPKRFLASGHVGFYLRVLQDGEVGAGIPSTASRLVKEA